MEKMAWDDPKWGQEDFFLLIQTLPTFWTERIWILRICNFFNFLDPKFLEFQVLRFPNSQIEAWAWADLDLLEHSSAVAPRWLPDHKVGEIQGTRTKP